MKTMGIYNTSKKIGIRWVAVQVFLLCSLYSYAWEQRDLLQKKANLEQIKQQLLPKASWVKYPAYTDRTGWNQLTGFFKKELIARGEKYLDFEWKVVKATDYIEYEKSGSRVAMENPFGANNTAISSLVMAELAEGEGRFMPQIINGVWQACDMSSWVLSAHLPVQKSRRSLPDFSEQIIDLTSGDMGSFFSWTYYFLKEEFDKVNPVISKRLRHELQRRILTPYMQRSDYWWQAFKATPNTMVNNWNPWCNFNVLSCFLLLEENADTLASAVHRTMVSVDKFINYNHSDGACEEGPSYWGHAAGKLYDYLQVLSYATNGRVSIFNEPMIKNMGEYIARSFVGNGWVVNFADASAKGGGDAGVIFRYGGAVGSTDMQHFASYLVQYKFGNNDIMAGRDFFRTIENLVCFPELSKMEPLLSNPKFTWYPETQFCYITNADGFFLAAKAGYNDESHNHNDVGTFSLYLHTIPFFIDAGVGTYTRQTFSSERYTIWTMQSNYHNLPMINGQPQKFGRKYRAKAVSADAANNIFTADIANAYDSLTLVEKWQRSYQLLPGKGLLITDHFKLKAAKAPNQLNFLVWAKPDVTVPGEVRLRKENKMVALKYDPKLFDVSVETIPQNDLRLSKVWGDALYRILLTAKKLTLSGKYTCTVQELREPVTNNEK